MKRYAREAVVLLIQMFLFYIFPLFAGPADAMGMVLMIILGTFALSAVIGGISRERIKFLYPAAAAMFFIPSVFVHYNESALIHSVWHLAVSAVGLTIGAVIRKIACLK